MQRTSSGAGARPRCAELPNIPLYANGTPTSLGDDLVQESM
jgi:hypothetical protein